MLTFRIRYSLVLFCGHLPGRYAGRDDTLIHYTVEMPFRKIKFRAKLPASVHKAFFYRFFAVFYAKIVLIEHKTKTNCKTDTAANIYQVLNMDNKPRITLGFKIYNLIIILVFASACFSILAGYREHTHTTDAFYEDLAGNIAETVSNSLNGTLVHALVDAAQTEEYRKIYSTAQTTQDDADIRAYLKKNHLFFAYNNINEILVQYTRYMDVKYIYLQYIGDGYFCRIIDPDAGYLAYGLTDSLDGPFIQYSGQNTSIPATKSTTEDGYLCTCFEPVYDSEGEAVAVVGVDINMDALLTKHRRFAFKSILNALILSTVAAVIGVFFMRRNVTGPLNRLAKAARKFTDKKGQYDEDDILDLSIHSRDEIEVLYEEIRSMERKIVQYLKHLVKVTGEKERTRTELGIAARIQDDMLPNSFPAFPDRSDFDLYASMDPAKEIGGDFYDFFLLDDDHLVLTIADVSSKGIPAALFMAITKSLLKVSMHSGDSPSAVLTKLNDLICRNNETGMFVSVWLGILELSTGVLTASNAGHEYPVLSRKGCPFEILRDKHGLVLAALEGIKYTEYQLTLSPGDRLFVYTDGVVEATDKDNKLFGMDRMVDSLNRDPDADPEKLIRQMTDSIRDFVGNAPQFDDITMLSFVYKP